MSERKISVFIKEPGQKPRHVNISQRLENLQKTVGGYIETVTIGGGMVIICDEEGRLKDKPYCCNIGGIDFCGTIIICGVSGEEFGSVPISFEDFKTYFPDLFVV